MFSIKRNNSERFERIQSGDTKDRIRKLFFEEFGRGGNMFMIFLLFR